MFGDSFNLRKIRSLTMTEFVTIACKMPHGYLIEVGIQIGNGADKTVLVP